MTEQNIKNKEVDPGWNDPPVFSYESHQEHTRQNKGSALNKRVVFPLSSAIGNKILDASNNENRSEISTPPSQHTAKCPPKNLINSNDEIVSTSVQPIDNENNKDVPVVEIVISNFNDILENLYSNEEKDTSEIKRRLIILEKMWNEDKFSAVIKEKIYKLSLALKEGRYEDGDSLQRSLMVDHSNVCTTWMAAIRKLIYRKKEITNT